MSQQENNIVYTQKNLPSKLLTIGVVILIVGLVLAGASYLIDPVRASFNSLISMMFGLSVGLGILFIIGLEHLTGAVWSVPFRRVAEYLGGILYIVPILAIPVFLNMHGVFSWSDPAVIAKDHVLQGKVPYLNTGFFYIRFALAFIVLWFFFTMFKRNSIKMDSNPSESYVKSSKILSAVMMPFFAIFTTIMAVDWLMSVVPRWFSTIFGVYYFAGSFLAGLGALTLVVIMLNKRGYLAKGLGGDNYYSLGAFMFAITNFWSYIAFSQYMLIWYANLPEETFWFIPRLHTSWVWMTAGLPLIKFIIPYIFILSQPSKKDPKRLTIAAIMIMFGHYYDLFWLVMPAYHKEGFFFSWNELAFPILLIGATITYFAIVTKNKNLIPVNDPKLPQGINFHL
ncbi:MAG: quinol:cytochrome C oxidoreductase [Candidatus Kapabacteria bacterium]|nr:quinol:cytochrome C oxidoreductase [Candidatus Kapabacteria bacterium]